MSVEHTARHAADAGYRAVVVSDGTSTMNPDWQRAAIDYALTNVAEIVTVADLMDAM
jgi:gluconolactonase